MARQIELHSDKMVQENQLLRLVLGVCPALSITTVAFNSLIVGILVTGILILANFFTAVLGKKTPIFITLVAGLVTMADIIFQTHPYYPAVGDFLPFLVVNCLILGKFTARPLESALDGMKMGLGFTLIVTFLGILRETTGAGTCFGKVIFPNTVFTLMTSPSGGFLLFGLLLAFFALFTREKPLEESVEIPIQEETS